ncbi:MAG TPA: PAS domain S-box protein [Solirubrobacteraceae bacterium]|jgi:PAS domain S-box-containing protein|nr:PAS domain S-box protein [Solirubrobacteraceae bacterium]
MHTSELITAEIEGRLGVFPSFFAPALAVPDVLEQLWRQTLTSYLDNPLPEPFKERLFAYLSRLRTNTYCTICHSCQLRELGASAREIFDMLEPQLSPDPASAAHLLGAGEPFAQWPAQRTREEARIVVLAAHAFVKDDLATVSLSELRRLLARHDYSRLVALLSHIGASHDWVQAHPEISAQDDERVLRHLPALVSEEPGLAELFDGHGRTSTLARRDHLAAIVESADDAIVGETLEGAIVSWNRGAERLYGYSADMVLGMSTALLVPSDRVDEAAAIMQRIRRGERVEHADTVRLGIDGRRVEVSLAASPLRNASGALIGACSIARDVGDRKLRERYLLTLHNATRVLAQSRPVEQTLPVVLGVLCGGTGWAVAAAWMPTTRPGVPLQLRCSAFWHTPALDGAAFETTSRQLRLGAGEGLPGRVWETRQARWVSDVSAEPHSRRPDEAAQDGLRSCYLLPVRGRQEVAAVIEFLSTEIRAPDPLLLEMLNRAAGQIGEYLERLGPRETLVPSPS